MKVEQLMSRDVKTTTVDTSLAEAARIMWECDCGCVPIVDGERHVVGMVTDRDICMAAYLSGRPIRELPVGASMARNVLTCRAQDSVADARNVMREAQLRRLPVIDQDSRLVGILSINDIAREAERAREERRPNVTFGEVGLTLSAVSQPRAHSTNPS